MKGNVIRIYFKCSLKGKNVFIFYQKKEDRKLDRDHRSIKGRWETLSFGDKKLDWLELITCLTFSPIYFCSCAPPPPPPSPSAPSSISSTCHSAARKFLLLFFQGCVWHTQLRYSTSESILIKVIQFDRWWKRCPWRTTGMECTQGGSQQKVLNHQSERTKYHSPFHKLTCSSGSHKVDRKRWHSLDIVGWVPSCLPISTGWSNQWTGASHVW